MAVFQILQVGIGIVKMTSVHSIIPYFVWFASFPITLVTHLHYLSRGTECLIFFNDWRNFEKQLFLRNSLQDVIPTLRRTRIVAVTSTLITKVGSLLALSYVVILYPDAPFLLSHYHVIRNIVTLPVIEIVQLISIVLMLVLKILCETVPSLIFYQAGLEIQVLEEEVHHLFSILTLNETTESKLSNQSASNSKILFASKVRQISASHDSLRTLISRANSLFGLLMFLSYGMEFVVICTMLYSVLYRLKTSPEKIGIFLTVLIVNVYDLIFCTLLTAKTYRSSEHLRIVLASLLNRFWDLTAKEERDILLVLLGCLQTDPLSAIPLGLYRVTPNILMTITSLSMSYVIIMLQSK